MAERNRNPNTGDHHEEEGKDTTPTDQRNHEEETEGDWVALVNATRHEHDLFLFKNLAVYTCSGCNEKGDKIGYKCTDTESKRCHDFALHEVCAKLPDRCDHPFRHKCLLKFRPKTRHRRYCNACRKVLRGYVFETEKRDIRLHPLCMVLPPILHFNGHADHKLKLVARDKGRAYTCDACDTRIHSGWRYRCTEVACRIRLDLSCAKTEIYGIPESDTENVERTILKCTSNLSGVVKWVVASAIGAVVGSIGSSIFP